MKSPAVVILGLIVLPCAFNTAASQSMTLSPETQVRTRSITSSRVSPDGKHLAYAVSDAVRTADKSEFVTQVWLASTDGTENVQLTVADKSSTLPRWSPDA